VPNKPIFIYGLYDARTLSIRYVGKTHDLKQRIRLHMMRARDKKATVNPRFLNWVRLLTEAVPNPRRWDTTGPYIAGLLGCVVLEVTDNENWESAERKWIADIRPHGGLLNIATGGNGPTFNTAETRRRMSEAHRGKKHTPETRQAIADGQRGNKRSLLTRALIRSKALGRVSWNKGKARTEEEKRAISRACRAGWARKKGNVNA
jgi:hypothetical protein